MRKSISRDLGVHVEGFIAVSAHTVIASTSEKILAGRNADTVLAAYWAAKKSIELLKPGRKVNTFPFCFFFFNYFSFGKGNLIA